MSASEGVSTRTRGHKAVLVTQVHLLKTESTVPFLLVVIRKMGSLWSLTPQLPVLRFQVCSGESDGLN